MCHFLLFVRLITNLLCKVKNGTFVVSYYPLIRKRTKCLTLILIKLYYKQILQKTTQKTNQITYVYMVDFVFDIDDDLQPQTILSILFTSHFSFFENFILYAIVFTSSTAACVPCATNSLTSSRILFTI